MTRTGKILTGLLSAIASLVVVSSLSCASRDEKQEANACGSGLGACCAAPVLLVLAGFGVASVIGVYRFHSDEKRARLHNAHGALDETAADLKTWLPDCEFIIQSDAKSGCLFQADSASTRARKKSLRLMQDGFKAAELLFDTDPNRQWFIAKEKLEQGLKDCENCPVHNRQRRDAVCLVIQNKNN